MSEERTQLRATSMKGGEFLVALLLILICIFGWIETQNFDVEVSMTNTLGPAIFPQILFGGIIGGALFLIVQVMRDKSDRGTVKWGKSSKVFLAAGAMLFQALTFEELSTFIAAGITLPTLLWIADVKLKTILGVTIGFLLFVYVFFVLILRVPLPMQFLPTILG